MAAALYFHEQQKVWCVLAMEQGKTFVEVCQEFWVKYANAGLLPVAILEGKFNTIVDKMFGNVAT